MNYELFMAEAIAEARRGVEEGEIGVGAVAVLDDAMIARDHDRMQLQRDPTAHAVLLTLQAAARKLESRRLGDVTIFTTHEPCAMCVGAMLETQVATLVYAMPDEERGAAGGAIDLARASGLPHQISVISGVREAEVRRLSAGSAVAK
ncbi:MAG TPA: nucleoside deaminase [candidate division Zixibacteria bacterium]|nr:nucleoside deaminase [candidate division Zixibacteria bacterium]